MKKYSDDELLSLLKVCDTKAQSCFYESNFRPMVKYAMYWIRRDAAEDIVSERLMIAMGIAVNFDTLCHLINSTYISVRNASINDLRKDNTRKKVEANVKYPVADQGTALDIEKIYAEMTAQVLEGLKELPPETAAIIRSFYLEEKSITEIKMGTGIEKSNTIVKKKQRGLGLLRSFLKF